MSLKFPAKPLAYGEVTYWDDRYEKEREEHGALYNFDWYCSLNDFWPLVENYYAAEGIDMESIGRTLIIGCGNSLMPDILVREKKINNVLCIDWSKTAISFACARYANINGLEFALMDTRKLDRLPTDSFELILDKACLDSLFCTFESYRQVLRANSEICRVLKPNGKFISISLGSPAMRMSHYAHISLDWKVEHTLVPNKSGIHVYACTKKMESSHHNRRTSFLGKGEHVDLGEFLDIQDPEWKKRKSQPSMNHLKDKWTPGHVRLQRVRDADTILAAIRGMSPAGNPDLSSSTSTAVVNDDTTANS